MGVDPWSVCTGTLFGALVRAYSLYKLALVEYVLV